MEFFIKRCGKSLFVVEDSAGTRRTEPLAEGAAKAAHAELEAATGRERLDQLANDPEAQKRRAEKAAYQRVARDPDLKALHNVLSNLFPRKGEIARNTKRSWEQGLKLTESVLSFASSNPQMHAELNKTPGQRRVSRATKAKQQQGKGDEVRALTLEGMSQIDIAEKLGISTRQVRKHQTGK